MKKLLAALLFTLPTTTFALNLEGFYITAKVGVSKTLDTGATNYTNTTGTTRYLQNEDLGTGTAFGISVGKYLTDNFRLELEAIKRTGYEKDADFPAFGNTLTAKAKMQTEALFINGFYDFQPFSISNTAITPYLGGGKVSQEIKWVQLMAILVVFIIILILMAIPLISLPINSLQGLYLA